MLTSGFVFLFYKSVGSVILIKLIQTIVNTLTTNMVLS